MASLLQRAPSLLHTSVLAGDIDGVSAGLSEAPEDVLLPVDVSGGSCLHFAATLGRADIVALLLSGGAILNAADGEGWHALHEGVKAGHESVVSLLIRRGVILETPGAGGVHAIHVAAMNGLPGMVRLLLAAGSSHQLPDEGATGSSPLHYASCGGCLKVGSFVAPTPLSSYLHIISVAMSSLFRSSFHQLLTMHAMIELGGPHNLLIS